MMSQEKWPSNPVTKLDELNRTITRDVCTIRLLHSITQLHTVVQLYARLSSIRVSLPLAEVRKNSLPFPRRNP